ncbi:MAG: CPBP family intramembrane metalloprotease [bacterium]|nr:CPBP family intramembrane metalloprotease [bacterium]
MRPEVKPPIPAAEPQDNIPTTSMVVSVLFLSVAWMILLFWLVDQMQWKGAESIFVMSGLMALPCVIWTIRNKFSFVETFRLRWPGTRAVLYVIPLAIAMAVLTDAADRWWTTLVPADPEYLKQINANLQTNSLYQWWMLLLAAAVVAPIAEEFLFRGFVQGVLEIRMGAISAILWTAAVFSFFHFNYAQLFPLWILSLALGLLAWRVDSIIPALIMHAVNNALSLFSLQAANGELFPGYIAGEYVALQWVLLAAAIVLVCGYAYFRFPASESAQGTEYE